MYELDQKYFIRQAKSQDLQQIVALLSDDFLGKEREADSLEPYLQAFEEINSDTNQFLAVVENQVGCLVGTFQLTLIPGLSRSASKRLQIEGVRVAASERGKGLGTLMFEWAHRWGAEKGARLAQLTTDIQRKEAQHFYEKLGYEASHLGYKRPI